MEGGRREAVKKKGKRGWLHKKMRARERVRQMVRIELFFFLHSG
jgi:hypothetical protein